MSYNNMNAGCYDITSKYQLCTTYYEYIKDAKSCMAAVPIIQEKTNCGGTTLTGIIDLIHSYVMDTNPPEGLPPFEHWDDYIRLFEAIQNNSCLITGFYRR